jgi:hypothetical protein
MRLYGLSCLCIAGTFAACCATQPASAQQPAPLTSAPPSSSATPQTPVKGADIVLTDASVVLMVQKGFTEANILYAIRTHKNNFVLTSGAQLMQAHTQYHISTDVLQAMVAAAPSPTATQAFHDYLNLLQSQTTQTGTPAAQSAPPNTQPAKGLTNQDVYDMVAQKVPETTIAHLIQSQPTAFQLYSTPDYDDAVKHNVSSTLLSIMIQAAGPRAAAAGRQYNIDVQNRRIAAAKAYQEHIDSVRAQIKEQCPVCVSIFFYQYDTAHKTFIPNSLPGGVRKAVAVYTDLHYAAAHHIFIAAEPEAADYQVVWSEHDNTVTFHQSQVATGYSSTGEAVFVTHDQPFERMSNEYHFTVLPLSDKPTTEVLYKVHMQNSGLIIGRNHPDVDCWHDVEKFLQKLATRK